MPSTYLIITDLHLTNKDQEMNFFLRQQQQQQHFHSVTLEASQRLSYD